MDLPEFLKLGLLAKSDQNFSLIWLSHAQKFGQEDFQEKQVKMFKQITKEEM